MGSISRASCPTCFILPANLSLFNCTYFWRFRSANYYWRRTSSVLTSAQNTMLCVVLVAGIVRGCNSTLQYLLLEIHLKTWSAPFASKLERILWFVSSLPLALSDPIQLLWVSFNGTERGFQNKMRAMSLFMCAAAMVRAPQTRLYCFQRFSLYLHTPRAAHSPNSRWGE